MTIETAGPSDRSIRATARWVGLLNLLCAVPDGYSVSVLQKFVVRKDAALTAANILRSETLFRFGFVADVLSLVIFAGAAVVLYQTFRPAGRRAALFCLLLTTLGIAFQSLACIQDLTALLLLKGASGLSVPEAQGLALVFLRMHWYDYQLALLFYGCGSLTVGFLVWRSTFVPKIFGACMWIDGLGYVTFVLTSFLAPLVVTHIYPYVPFGTALGEGALFLWLIFRSVDVERWRAKAAAARAEGWA